MKRIVYRHDLRLKPAKEVSPISAPADITGVIVRGEQTLLPNRKLKLLAEPKAERRTIRNPKKRRRLDNRIAGGKV